MVDTNVTFEDAKALADKVAREHGTTWQLWGPSEYNEFKYNAQILWFKVSDKSPVMALYSAACKAYKYFEEKKKGEG